MTIPPTSGLRQRDQPPGTVPLSGERLRSVLYVSISHFLARHIVDKVR